MIGRASIEAAVDTLETQFAQIEMLDEGINDPDRIVLRDVIIEMFRKQGALASVLTLNKTLHGRPLLY